MKKQNWINKPIKETTKKSDEINSRRIEEKKAYKKVQKLK